MMFRWLGGTAEAFHKEILIAWAKATGKAPGYPTTVADLDPNSWGCRDKEALAQFTLLWPGLGKPALVTDGTCVTGKPVAELTDAIKKALWDWQSGGTPVNPCKPGEQLDPTGKLCVPVPTTNIVMDFFNAAAAAAAAAAPAAMPASGQTVNFGEQSKPPAGGGTTTPEQQAKPPGGCPPGETLKDGKCVSAWASPPPEVEVKKTPWVLITLGLAGAAGLVWSLTRGASEVGGALRANPYASRAHLRAMTKVEAKRQFETYVLPDVVKQYGPGDRVAIREAWNNWTDALHRDGRITRKQVDTWVSPYG